MGDSNATVPEQVGNNQNPGTSCTVDDILVETAFERITNTMTNFCFFLRDLYVDDDAVLVPPDSGWPEITKESFAPLGKSDAVINVLRHLTYINRDGLTEPYKIKPDVSLMDWRDPSIIRDIANGDVQGIKDSTQGCENEVEPDIIGLGSCSENIGIPLLNCARGTVEDRYGPWVFR